MQILWILMLICSIAGSMFFATIEISGLNIELRNRNIEMGKIMKDNENMKKEIELKTEEVDSFFMRSRYFYYRNRIIYIKLDNNSNTLHYPSLFVGREVGVIA